MATESLEKELEALKAQKAESAKKLNNELTKAEKEYNQLIQDIKSKYQVAELDEKIKRQEYAIKILKGETPLPEGTGKGKKGNIKTVESDKSSTRIDWNTIIPQVLKKIGKTIKEASTEEIRNAIAELYPEIDVKASKNNIANAVTVRKNKA